MNLAAIVEHVAREWGVDRVILIPDEFLARNVAFDLYFLDDGRYSITNALVLSSAQNPFTTTGRENGDCLF